MESGLLSLPTELLLLIFRQLSPITQHALSLSCRQLYALLASSCLALNPGDRHSLLGRLARDGMALRNFLYCSDCRSIHQLAHFPPGQLDQPPESRRCSSSIKRLWFDRQKVCSFNELHHGPSLSNFLQEHGGDPLRNTVIMEQTMQYALCAQYPLISLPESKSVSEEEMSRILHGFDIPTCPHIRLGNSIIKRSYYPSRLSVPEPVETITHWFRQNSAGRVHARCDFPECNTVFRWVYHTSEWRFGWKTLSIQMKREIGSLLSPLQPEWLAQLSEIPSMVRLESHLRDCHQWKDVNMAIEEKRYEWGSAVRSYDLDKAKQFELDQLRRENDYLRHPYRSWRQSKTDLQEAVSSCLSSLQESDVPVDGLPSTTQLLSSGPYGCTRRQENTRIPFPGEAPPPDLSEIDPAETTNRADPRHSVAQSERGHVLLGSQFGNDLLMPLYDRATVMRYGESSKKFNELFHDIKTLTPIQERLEHMFWGQQDCLSRYGSGVLGLLTELHFPIFRRRLFIDQFYRLPGFMKRALVNRSTTNEPNTVEESTTVEGST